MKVKIKHFKGDLPHCLTLDKLYGVEEVLDDQLFLINDDNEDDMVIFVENCAHLNYGSWEVIDE